MALFRSIWSIIPLPRRTRAGHRCRELLQSGACEIGAQLHPWVTPPFVEHVSAHNSYAGNLPAALEFAKIQALTDELEQAFGQPPRIFRAGRYGVGPNTGGMLSHFGYEADSSVVPCWNFASQGGPDFRRINASPYWIDHGAQSARTAGLRRLCRPGRRTAGAVDGPGSSGGVAKPDRLPSVMARLGLLERIKLTPEGITIEEAKRLVRHMAGRDTRFRPDLPQPVAGTRQHALCPHRGRTWHKFLRWLDEFYDFFTIEIGGVCASWRDVRTALRTRQADRGGEVMRSA